MATKLSGYLALILALALQLVLALFLIQGALAATSPTAEPRFVEPIQNVTVTSGRDVKLACVVENLGSYKIAWIAYDKSAILTVQEHVITRNPRINVTYDGYRTWTLHIERVNASDAGTYMCQVNTIVALSQFGTINVVVPPNILDSESSGDVMVQEGANVTLMCSAMGTPTPSITWRREDGKKINVNKTHSVIEFIGDELRLARISRTDMAAYLCIARNGVPPIVSKRIQVSVDFPPMMTIPHQLVGAPLGYSIALECSIEAHPPPLTYWTKGKGESAMLHQSRKYVIEDKPGDESYKTYMKLNIRNLRDKDFGTYKCIAKNSRGETEGEMNLYKSEPPTTTSSTPSSYYDKIFKVGGTNKKVQNSLTETLYGEDKVISEEQRESGIPYIPDPRDPISFGDVPDDNEVFSEGRRRMTSDDVDDTETDYGVGVERQSNRRGHGHFINNFFSSANGLQSSWWTLINIAVATWLQW